MFPAGAKFVNENSKCIFLNCVAVGIPEKVGTLEVPAIVIDVSAGAVTTFVTPVRSDVAVAVPVDQAPDFITSVDVLGTICHVNVFALVFQSPAVPVALFQMFVRLIVDAVDETSVQVEEPPILICNFASLPRFNVVPDLSCTVSAVEVPPN